jgi:uncharacterized protein YecE (DUF72 family)
MSVRIGCSGWSYEHWRGVLYPDRGASGSWLARYAEVFDTVEVNATFYRLPKGDTVARWAEMTPDGFVFAAKASRYLTHVRRLRELPPGIALLYERIQPIVDAAKLGPILWQLPRTFARDDERLGSALRDLPPGRHAFEFRHQSWYADEVYALLAEHRAALVVADRAGSTAAPWIDTAGWWYLRFHHGRGREGLYTRSQLRSWAERIGEARGDVYAYFNNDWNGYALVNARTLLGLVGSLQEARS